MTPKIYRRKRVNFLKMYPVVRQVMCKNKGLNKRDFDLILYLDDLTYFTRSHFKQGLWWYDIEYHKLSRLVKDDWIVQFYKGVGAGDHSKYKLSLKARRMVTMTYKYCYLEEYIPEHGIDPKNKKLFRFVTEHNKQLKHERRKRNVDE